MTYAEALAYLQSFTDHERLVAAGDPNRFRLDRIDLLLDLLGRPERAFSSIHVVGTKGKGSTAVMIANSLQAAGYRVGLYTSPHLHTFRERIRVAGRCIRGPHLAALAADIRPIVDTVRAGYAALGWLTAFEVATALAFKCFAEELVDCAVVEAGLGGRLDATNVLQPLVTVLTPIGLDHTEYLGNTIAAIAGEKAAVIKPGGIAVSAEQRPEARAVIVARAREVGTRLFFVGEDYRWQQSPHQISPQTICVAGPGRQYPDLRVPLLGLHQSENAALAVAALDALSPSGINVPAEAIRRGIATVQWQGRLELLGREPTLLVDGAHNPDAMRRLCAALEDLFPAHRRIFVLGSSADKDMAGIIAALAPYAAVVVVTQSRHPRAANAERYAALVAAQGLRVETAASVPAALERARALSSSDDLICVTGSLFVVAEAREFILGRDAVEAD